jgi:hypothetical protein
VISAFIVFSVFMIINHVSTFFNKVENPCKYIICVVWLWHSSAIFFRRICYESVIFFPREIMFTTGKTVLIWDL